MNFENRVRKLESRLLPSPVAAGTALLPSDPDEACLHPGPNVTDWERQLFADTLQMDATIPGPPAAE